MDRAVAGSPLMTGRERGTAENAYTGRALTVDEKRERVWWGATGLGWAFEAAGIGLKADAGFGLAAVQGNPRRC